MSRLFKELNGTLYKKCNKCLEWQLLKNYAYEGGDVCATHRTCNDCKSSSNLTLGVKSPSPVKSSEEPLIEGQPILKCKKCEIVKSVNYFYKSTKNKSGYRSACKKCTNEATNKYNTTHREQVNAKAKENRLNNPEAHDTRVKEYREKNREKIRKRNREYQREYKKNPLNRAIHNLRCRVYDAMAKGVKSDNTKALLGCTEDELRSHLTSLFTEGMTWDNYGTGGWAIDHIMPIASFNLLDPEEVLPLF
jgi:hypothetical protein